MANPLRAPVSGGRLQSQPQSRRSALRGRARWYAALGLLTILVLAYIDGGEEPIRPITQSVEVPGSESE